MESFERSERDVNRPHLDAKEVHEYIYIECPECEKRYVVNCLDVENELPEFVCNKCETAFFVDLNVEDFSQPLRGLKVQEKKDEEDNALNQDIRFFKENKEEHFQLKNGSATEGGACPKCDTKYVVGQPECFRCGLILSKSTAQERGTLISATPELKQDWLKLITNFTNIELHNGFIERALKEKNLKYAAYRYGQLKKITPDDDITQEMLDRITKLTEAVSGHLVKEPKKTKSKFGVSTYFGIIAVAFVGMGMFLPQFRNLVGVGVALLFLIIAMRLVFNKN
ncbi:MAG: hypothetical protein KDD50_01705 [Bdellovibrionales bacterium]|nr:hypothetical protein [Bdellovibrionales bacterium]